MLETTRQKVERLFSAETRKRIENAGLLIVDKEDFTVVLDGYNSLTNENRSLRIELAKLKKKI